MNPGNRGRMLHRFFNQEMGICHGSNLRQMSDADDLVRLCQQFHLLRYHLCRTPADSTVNLIKDQRRNLIRIRHDGLDRERNTGKFSAGSDLSQRL